MTLGALVVADEARDLAASIVTRAIEGVPFAMKGYAPDGAYPEGASYWEYGTSYNVLLVAALQKALGSDFGLLAQPGFDRTAEYRLHVAGPAGWWFNYVDSGLGGRWRLSPAMQFLAAWRNDPSLLHGERAMLQRLVEQPDVASADDTDRLLPLLLVWHVPGEARRDACLSQLRRRRHDAGRTVPLVVGRGRHVRRHQGRAGLLTARPHGRGHLRHRHAG